jgi:septal ring factor EnvC (AmiA/AmiB activator)
MKRIVLLVALVMLIMVLVTGCVVSKKTYDAAIKESNDLKEQLSTLQAELAATQADLATTQANLNKSNADLLAAQEAISTLNASLEKAQLYADVVPAWFNYYSNTSEREAAIPELTAAISATQDGALQSIWNTILTTTGTAHTDATWTFANMLLKRLSEAVPETN